MIQNQEENPVYPSAISQLTTAKRMRCSPQWRSKILLEVVQTFNLV